MSRYFWFTSWLFTVAVAYITGVHIGTVSTLAQQAFNELERTFKRIDKPL